MPLDVLVVISPRKGCEARCLELVPRISKGVKEDEPETSAYSIFSEEAKDGEESDFYIYLEVTNEEHINERTKLPTHQEIRGVLKEENLLRKPLRYIVADEKFSWRR